MKSENIYISILIYILNKMKRNKAKNEYHTLCTKYRALMHVENDCPANLTKVEQAEAASNHIGHVISSRTWDNWLRGLLRGLTSFLRALIGQF